MRRRCSGSAPSVSWLVVCLFLAWGGRPAVVIGGRHVRFVRINKTLTDSPATRSYMHPAGPYGRAGTHTRCHCGGSSGGSPVLSVRSHYTTMQRARFRGGWTMSQARPRQHADGRLVSTRSCWCALARVATAAARAVSGALLLHSGGAAAGVARHNPIPMRPPVGWRGAAMPCHSGGSARGVWSTGLSGRLPKFPSRSIWGSGG